MFMQQKTLYILLACIVLLFASGIFLFIDRHSKSRLINEITAQFELEKEELEDGYSQLALQYESYGIRIANDSLAELLDIERTKNLRLLEEIRTLKINNVVRINELRKELETARSVMRSYIIQIDSLNTLTTRLRKENETVSRQYREIKQEASQLAKANTELTEKVVLASILEARDINIRTLNERERVINRLSKIATIEFNFYLPKNISAKVGEKNIYLRILQPDNTPLVKNEGNLFEFEGTKLNYSIFRPIEYAGEETPVSLYWKVEEFLYPGTYRADFFADGFLIGSKSFELLN
jgi:multidrug efflux pump subunit AcrA (membrane-fusion protein)